MTTNNTPPPDQNRPQERENRQPHWIIQVLIQIVIIRVMYSVYTSTKKTLSPKSAEALKTYKNYFEKGELFDLYGVVSTDIRIDFKNIGENAILAYINENQEYDHRFNRPFERKRVRIITTDEFHDDLNKNLYFTVFLIPHKSYLRKEREFYRSTFKEGIDGHYLVKTIPLTKKMKAEPTSEGVNLISDSPNQEKAKAAKDANKARVYEKYFVPRVDINLVFDLKHYSTATNDVYFESFTKHHVERLYDPYLYLSQFWVLQDQMVKVTNFGEDEDFKGPGEHRAAPKDDTEPEPFHKNSEHMQVGERFELWSDVTGEATTEHEDSYLESVVALRDTELQKVGDNKDKDAGLSNWNMLELEINYSTCLGLYYMVLHNMTQKPTHNLFGIDNTKEIDVLKKTLMTTNVYFLVFSALFILLHTVFSVFALKNGGNAYTRRHPVLVQQQVDGGTLDDHARNQPGLRGTRSARADHHRPLRVRQRGVVGADTLRNTAQRALLSLEADQGSQGQGQTGVPLRVHRGPGVYSLYKNKYKSWYSYVISVLAGSVYTFGERPITHRIHHDDAAAVHQLQTQVGRAPAVEGAHIQVRTDTPRSLNTFVDDVASFLIDMPMLHRLSCFRDDIIFFCYLYQRWKYRVDPNRRVGGSAEGAQELTHVEDAQEEDAPRLRPNAGAGERAAAEAEGQTQPQ